MKPASSLVHGLRVRLSFCLETGVVIGLYVTPNILFFLDVEKQTAEIYFVVLIRDQFFEEMEALENHSTKT